MTPTVELRSRQLALVLTAVVLLQLIWGVARLLLQFEPEPIHPAESSLQVDELRVVAALDEQQARDMVRRPVFWQGRQAHAPSLLPAAPVEAEPVPVNTDIDALELLGVYAAGDTSGVIVALNQQRSRLLLHETIAGWTFSSLDGTRAVFTLGGETREFPLEHAFPAAPPRAERAAAARPEKSEKAGKSEKQDKTGE